MKRALFAILLLAGWAVAQTNPPSFQAGTINNCSTAPPTLDAVGQAFLSLTPSAPVGAVCNYASIAEQIWAASLALQATSAAQMADLESQLAQLRAAAFFSVSPSSLTFPTTTVGSTSAGQTITIKNIAAGSQALTSPKTITGPFSITAGGCTVVATGNSCVLTVTFKPVAAGPASGMLTLSYPVGTYTVSLSGTGQ